MLKPSKSLILFVLYILSEQFLHKKNQREIAKLTALSLGSVNKFYKLLEKEGLLENHEKLLDFFASFYSPYLLEELKTKRYSSTSKQIYADLRQGKIKQVEDFYSSATLAASLLGHSILPDQFLFYGSSKKLGQIIRALKLRPDDRGDIEIREKFWNFDYSLKERGLAPLALIYSDLLTSQNSRDREIAKLIRKTSWK